MRGLNSPISKHAPVVSSGNYSTGVTAIGHAKFMSLPQSMIFVIGDDVHTHWLIIGIRYIMTMACSLPSYPISWKGWRVARSLIYGANSFVRRSAKYGRTL